MAVYRYILSKCQCQYSGDEDASSFYFHVTISSAPVVKLEYWIEVNDCTSVGYTLYIAIYI